MRLTESKRRCAAVPLRWQIFQGGRSRRGERCSPIGIDAFSRCDDSTAPCESGLPRRAAADPMRWQTPGRHSLAAELIRLNEAEKERLAAELRETINRHIAVIALELGALAKNLPRSRADIRHGIVRIQERTVALSNEVRSLSHTLNPLFVQRLGLCTALKVYCREFAQRTSTQVEFVGRVADARYPIEIEFALFRVCQEALWNLNLHSHAAKLTVTLRAQNSGLLLSIADGGCGFDMWAHPEIDRLGLISMRERVHQAGGQVAVRSVPNTGTEVEVFIPVSRMITGVAKPKMAFAESASRDAGNVRQLLPELTARELEVLRLVAEGRTLKEIAGILSISQSTAGFHKYNVMRKLKLNTAAQLIRHAIKCGLIAV